MSRFTQRHLDPGSRLGEILFGLIMVLTVTLTAGLTVTEGRAGVRHLLLAAIGSNVAWGIIDAVMYIMNCMIVRRGKLRLVEAVQHASDPGSALFLVREGLEPELQELLPPGGGTSDREVRRQTYRWGAHHEKDSNEGKIFTAQSLVFGWSLFCAYRRHCHFSFFRSHLSHCASLISSRLPRSFMLDKNGLDTPGVTV